MSKVYLLQYEHGEYSDYEVNVVGVFSSERNAKRRKAQVMDYKAELKAYNDTRIQAAADAGYARCPTYKTNFWMKRKKWWDEWTTNNPQPPRPEHLATMDEAEYVPWDAEWSIVPYVVDA